MKLFQKARKRLPNYSLIQLCVGQGVEYLFDKRGSRLGLPALRAQANSVSMSSPGVVEVEGWAPRYPRRLAGSPLPPRAPHPESPLNRLLLGMKPLADLASLVARSILMQSEPPAVSLIVPRRRSDSD